MIPGNYTFTAADAGKHTFLGGWNTEMPGALGAAVADVADGTVAADTTGIDELSTVHVKDGRVRLSVGAIAILMVEGLR